MVIGQIDLPMERIAELCRKYRVKELSLFGSALGDEFRAGSDIDLLVELRADHGLDLVDYIEMQMELSELLGRQVDLVDKRGLKAALRQPILDSARVVYAD